MAKNQSIAEKVELLIEPVINDLGYLLWNLEYVKEGNEYYLRITIDNDKGCNIDDCEKVSNAVEPVLDESDPIEQAYILEVSTPGLERELCKPWHFEQCLGETIDIKLFTKDEYGKKEHTGVLKEYNKDELTIDEDGNAVKIKCSTISKANLHFDFDEII